jgi:hypothetical protein
MTSPSLAGMHIQFLTLTFYSRLEEQLQERLCLKKSATSLPAAIGALASPLGPYPESDLSTDLYSGSTLIAIMDEFDHRISFNILTKFVISLLVVIGTSNSLLEPRTKRDLATDIYTLSLHRQLLNTSLITGSDLDDFKKSTTSL